MYVCHQSAVAQHVESSCGVMANQLPTLFPLVIVCLLSMGAPIRRSLKILDDREQPRWPRRKLGHVRLWTAYRDVRRQEGPETCCATRFNHAGRGILPSIYGVQCRLGFSPIDVSVLVHDRSGRMYCFCRCHQDLGAQLVSSALLYVGLHHRTVLLIIAVQATPPGHRDSISSRCVRFECLFLFIGRRLPLPWRHQRLSVAAF